MLQNMFLHIDACTFTLACTRTHTNIYIYVVVMLLIEEVRFHKIILLDCFETNKKLSNFYFDLKLDIRGIELDHTYQYFFLMCISILLMTIVGTMGFGPGLQLTGPYRFNPIGQ